MSEKRFTFSTKWRWILFDNETEKFMDMEDCKDKLNEQQSEINSLKIELKLSSGEKLFSRRELERKVDEQQDTIRKLRNENIILKNKIEDLRVSLFMQDKVLQRQMQKSDLDE